MNIKYKFNLFVIMIFVINNAFSHKCESLHGPKWAKGSEYNRVERHLVSLFKCINTDNSNDYVLRDKTACNWFVANAIELIYDDNSFMNGDKYYTANQMASMLSKGKVIGWKRIGKASEQKYLTLAGSLVEQGKPVVAAWLNSANGHGHVNILMPGGLINSPSWGLEVPNSANLSIDNINGAYIGCSLASGFGTSKKNDVYLYTSK